MKKETPFVQPTEYRFFPWIGGDAVVKAFEAAGVPLPEEKEGERFIDNKKYSRPEALFLIDKFLSVGMDVLIKSNGIIFIDNRGCTQR